MLVWDIICVVVDVAYPNGCNRVRVVNRVNRFSRVSLMAAYLVCMHIGSLEQKVMSMLHELFCKLDMACEKYTVYKVETIGDVSTFVGAYPAYDRWFASFMCRTECCISCVWHLQGVKMF